ncbi:response regulator [Desulfohalovibrio reitneri]|uniref:response regulator n=1 Tax=Desulfohalovibrio reitneri TaxID=1307759 RepID=UPI0004A6B5A5|nr:response regulator [Desulfohalovibrio reitneri]
MTSPEEHNLTRPIRVLLVEDNPDDIELTTEALQESKLKVDLEVVQDGEAALQCLRREGKYAGCGKPDLMLLDLNLPRKDGLEVLREIKRDEELQRIPVVVLTISQDEQDVLKAYDLHANCFITKPVDFERFIEVVRSIEGFWLTIVKLP